MIKKYERIQSKTYFEVNFSLENSTNVSADVKGVRKVKWNTEEFVQEVKLR